MIGEKGENYLSVASGANYCLDRRHIDKAVSLFDESGVAMFQNEIKPDTLCYAMAQAKDRRAKVLLNFAPARSVSQDLLELVSVLVVNHSEAEMLTQKRKFAAKLRLKRQPTV